ncbi:MAG TPA: hypothetical protein IAB84_10930 [Candidatus Choladousia intestinigallinarum]|nr:hypothetical protein [Candidatus Choladousia intestinigallinarum]
MYAVGIDIGTTTVCGVLLDVKNGRVEDVKTLDNDAAFRGQAYERLQNPERIWELVENIYKGFLLEHPQIACIGLTGQMHGILYTDRDGKAASPLFSWQDERGNEPYPGEEGKTYAQVLSELTGYSMATGFGLTTHFYNLKNNLIPEGAVSFCTIQDYMGMRLTGRKAPCLAVSDGASLGCFDLEQMEFDRKALEKAGINPEILPSCTADCSLLGKTAEGIPVSTGIGDNQASVIGSVRELEGSVLVNVGTASQISTGLTKYVKADKTELRAISRDQYILVGAGLCGGRAYAALESFFRRTVERMTGKDPGKLYGAMEKILKERGSQGTDLKVDTRFCGTRTEPGRRGGIENLGLENFTPEEFILGVLDGMAEELHTFYREMEKLGVARAKYLIGSGNGLRMNPWLQRIFEERFGLPMQIPVHKEEAAYGAALWALTAAGAYPSIREAQQMIAYE